MMPERNINLKSIPRFASAGALTLKRVFGKAERTVHVALCNV